MNFCFGLLIEIIRFLSFRFLLTSSAEDKSDVFSACLHLLYASVKVSEIEFQY